MNQFQKTTKFIAMTFAVILAVGIISAITGVVLNVLSAVTGAPIFGNRNRIDIAYDFTGVESLSIDNSAGSLEIRTGDTFRVEGSKVTEGFQAELTENGTLVVSEHHKNRFLGFDFDWFSSPNSKITVYLPADFVAERAKLETGAGNTVIEALRAEELTISAGAGNLNGDQIVAEKVILDSGVGSFTLTGVSFHNAEIDCGVGSLRIEGELLGHSKIDCGVGDVKLDLVGSREDYSLDVDAGVGSVRVNGEKLSGSDTNEYAEHSLKVDGGVGKVSIDFRN